jgi:transketolase
LLEGVAAELPRCPIDAQLCQGGQDSAVIEKCAWDALLVVRRRLETDLAVTRYLAGRLLESRDGLDRLVRLPRADAPRVEAVYETAREMLAAAPEDLMSKVGSSATLRGELGLALAHCNRRSGGALLTAAADLLGSTSVNVIGESFGPGFYNAQGNPAARILSLGGICEDGATGILSGISTFGHHIGVVASYGAFLAPLAHIGARLHAIGGQARQAVSGDAFKPMVVICAHAGLMTGEDGPTHADPQALQLLQENFPPGTVVTLTPWEPREVWTLVGAALAGRPAVIAPFVTRPTVRVPDRARLGLASASAAATGVYKLRQARGKPDGVVVLQESGATLAFVEEALPLLEKAGIDLDVYYVASSELFDRLAPAEQERVFPAAASEQAMGITGFTRQTMYRWIRSVRGREFTLHPFQHGHFLASGRGEAVMQEAGLDGASQYEAIRRFLGGSPRA